MDKLYFLRLAVHKCFDRNHGSVTVEFAIIFPVFILLALILLDFTALYANESRLARTGSSLASVLRERTLLFDKDEDLTGTQVDLLYEITNELLNGSQLANKVSVNVQAVYFQNSSTLNNKIIDTSKTLSISKLSSVNPVPCAPMNDIESDSLTDLSVWSGEIGGTLRWLPVYQISLCVKGDESYFLKAFSFIGAITPTVISSNAVVPR
ncbi:pilus assembly protein [Salmonella enterica]|nr:pilus assembly protein [Salmonella enterica]MBA3176362.1 hypothetical protein [Salmonella enterica]HCI3390789.1 pilus assembly protein [Salmonella enterica subsp. enterica serovar Infantis]HCI9959465.1 pilus assembly protein [Salmonella enterica subsp. enterica serovar Infantis]